MADAAPRRQWCAGPDGRGVRRERGVGSTLVQLARLAGTRVIGTASARHHDRRRELGAEPVDRSGDVAARVRELAPAGVDAVFDHVGGPGMVGSWRMLAPGGTLVCYGTAATRACRATRAGRY